VGDPPFVHKGLQIILPVDPLLLCHGASEQQRSQRPDFHFLALLYGASPGEHQTGRQVNPGTGRVTCLRVTVERRPPQRLELGGKAKVAHAAGIVGVPSGHNP